MLLKELGRYGADSRRSQMPAVTGVDLRHDVTFQESDDLPLCQALCDTLRYVGKRRRMATGANDNGR